MLTIHLLGRFLVERDGAPVEIASRTAQSLLAYLAINPGVSHRREKLAGMFWPDAAEANARNNLRHALWRIRKAIEGGQQVLVSSDITVAFEPTPEFWLDVQSLEQPTTETTTAEELMSAVAVYKGELLPGFYDDWTVLERERLQAVFGAKLQALLSRLGAEGRWGEVLEWAERWIVLAHRPEPAYRALMFAHAQRGDLAGVAAAFQRCTQALREELGVSPSEETAALFRRLSSGEKVLDFAAEVRIGQAREELPAPGKTPFKGLEYFDVADAGIFFGREMLVARLVRHLREHRFLAIVVGASGSGKSSIVRAGLIPALLGDGPLADGALPPPGSKHWIVHVLTPTETPLMALSHSLLADSGDEADYAGFSQELVSESRRLRRHAEDLLKAKGSARHNEAPRLLLVVDQFEELFSLCQSETERTAFIDNLMEAASPGHDGPATVVIALRADFYANCAHYANLRDALARHQEYIGPMSAAELRRAIEEPARRGGWEFESGLVDLILRDVGDEPGSLPLLSHALLETWNRRRGRTLTYTGYAASGGVRGAIARTAEKVYQQFTPEEQAIARRIFLNLTELGEEIGGGALPVPDTRRRAAVEELARRPEETAAVQAVLRTLVDARLVTAGEGTVEVAHEALIREWPTLRQWLEEDRENLLLHRTLGESAQGWEELERDPGELYRGARLAQVLEWASSHTEELSLLEREFLEASQAQAQAAEAEREAQRQRELEATRRLAEAESRRAEEQSRAAQQLRRRALFLAGALLATALLATLATILYQQTKRAASLATSRELAAAAISNLDVDPERSVLLALEALSNAHTYQAEGALHQAVQASRVRMSMISPNGEQIMNVTFSPDGRRLATAEEDGSIRVWDTFNGEELLTIPAHSDPVHGLAFSPDGVYLASTSWDGTTRMWDASSGQKLLEVPDHTSGSTGAAFHPDGSRLAFGDFDGEGIVADTATGEVLLKLVGHQGEVWDVAFSPDGKRLATASFDQTTRIWDLASGEEILTLSGHTDFVMSVAYSPDGRRVVTGSNDQTAKIWDANTGMEIITLNAHHGGVLDVAFSRDGSQIATVGTDSTAKIWDTSNGKELLALFGHVGWIYALSFGPDGTRLATAGTSGARIWDITPSHEWLTIPGNGFSLGAIAYNPDGTLVATAGHDGTARLWDVATSQEVKTLSEHEDAVGNLAFSPDGQRLATASADGTAKIFDLPTGKQLLTFEGHSDWVNAVVYSPNGAQVVIASGDGTVRVWDAATGQQERIFSGNGSPFETVAISPDGRLLVAAGNERDGSVRIVRVWDILTGEVVHLLKGHFSLVWSAAFSPDGARLATSDLEGFVVLWDAKTGEQLRTLSGRAGAIYKVVFTHDGLWIAGGSQNGSLTIWEAATGQELFSLFGHEGRVVGAAVSPDDRFLATAGEDGTVRIYLLQLEELIELAKSRLTRSLTHEECRQYLHVEVCP